MARTTQAINNRNSGYASKKKVSTAFRVGDILTLDTDGFLVPGGAGKAVGISNEVVVAGDADYAVARDLSFQGFKHDDEFLFPVITGTATQTLVGELVDISGSDARGVDVTASTNDQVQVVRIIDAATIVGRFVVQVS